MNKDIVRKIWCEELNLEDVKDDDDFFALGGHSLIMVKIQTKLKKDVGIAVPMDELFRHSSVKSIAEYIDTKKSA